MATENHFSPAVIPPRTSSNPHSPRNSRASTTLRPLPEGDWLSPRQSQAAMQSQAPTQTSQAPSNPKVMPVEGGPDPSRYSRGATGTQTGRMWSADKEKILLGPYDYLLTHPGKDIRAQAIAAFNEVLRVPASSLVVITKVIGMLHTASLLVDDVEDSSLLRRGVPVAHSIFGTAQTINSANYVYFCALQELFKLEHRDEAIQIYTEELLNLHRGQGMDLFWRDTLTCPTEEDYLEMVGNKTGGLFRLAVKLMQAESQTTHDCVPLVNLIGTIFQINDDYINLCSTNYSSLKGMCEDLTEGKFSFPIIHAIRSRPENLQLLNILKQRTTDAEVKKYALEYMESVGSFEYCRTVLTTLLARAQKLVDELENGATSGAGNGIRKILDVMKV